MSSFKYNCFYVLAYSSLRVWLLLFFSSGPHCLTIFDFDELDKKTALCVCIEKLKLKTLLPRSKI